MTFDPSTPLGRLLVKHRDAVLRIARKHGASNVRVFGSVARGEAQEKSDIDILVTIEPDRSLFDIIRLQLDLEDLLGVPVDVVEDKALSGLFRESVIQEAVAV